MSTMLRGFVVALAGATLATPSLVAAQDRLVGLRALGGSVTVDGIRFGGDGLPQSPIGGQDSLRVRSVRQVSIPVTAAMPLGDAWTVDVATMYVSGSVSYDAPASTSHRTATLAGLSDVRVRAVGRFANDAFVVTLGANAPTGRAHLDGEELTAVRVIAAPALALTTPPVGAGGSGTVGVLTAHAVGGWAVAGGASYELHGSYAPIGALVAGAPTTDYQPGDVLHLSLGADGLVGRNRLGISNTLDLFGTDRLRASAGSAPVGTLASVRLGPALTTDVQLHLAVPSVRDATLWVTNQWRASFQRDGATVAGSSGDFVNGGGRVTLPLARRTDLALAADARWQSGLDFDDSILTAGGTAFGVTAGLAHRIGAATLQPYVRLQAGRVAVRDGVSSTMTGGSLGLTVLSRF